MKQNDVKPTDPAKPFLKPEKTGNLFTKWMTAQSKELA